MEKWLGGGRIAKKDPEPAGFYLSGTRYKKNNQSIYIKGLLHQIMHE